jgi:hypothetical protein
MFIQSFPKLVTLIRQTESSISPRVEQNPANPGLIRFQTTNSVLLTAMTMGISPALLVLNAHLPNSLSRAQSAKSTLQSSSTNLNFRKINSSLARTGRRRYPPGTWFN